jgi:DNA-directed RNA polymerase subunit RPC12/RpoP
MVINMNASVVYQCSKCQKDFVFINNGIHEKCKNCGYDNFNNYKSRNKINSNPLVRKLTSSKISVFILRYATIILAALTLAAILTLFLKATTIFIVLNILSMFFATLFLLIFYEKYYNLYSSNKIEPTIEYLALAVLLITNLVFLIINLPLIIFLDGAFLTLILVIISVFYLFDSKKYLDDYVNNIILLDPNNNIQNLVESFKQNKGYYDKFTKNFVSNEIKNLILVYVVIRIASTLLIIFSEITADIFLINIIGYILYLAAIIAPLIIYGYIFYDGLIKKGYFREYVLSAENRNYIKVYHLRGTAMNVLYLGTSLLLFAYYFYELLVIRLGVF